MDVSSVGLVGLLVRTVRNADILNLFDFGDDDRVPGLLSSANTALYVILAIC